MAAIPRANGAYVSALRTEDMLADLYNGLADQYIKEHENEYKDDAEKAAARQKFLEDNKNIIEAVSRASNRIVDTNWGMVYSALPKKSNTPKVDEHTKQAYADIVQTGFTNKLLDALRMDPLKLRTTQTGIELMEGVTARAHAVSFTPTRKFGIFGNIQAEKDAFQNILDKGGKFIEYDLEGIDDFITQYAFAEVDKNMKGPLKTSSSKMTTGLIGLTEEGESKILALVDEYDKKGMRGTGWKGLEEKYSYVMDELLKFGMSDWHIDKNTGRAVLDAYASDADIRNLDLDPKQRMATIRQGVTKLRDINKALTKDTVTFMGEKVYAYERDILQQIAFSKKGNKDALTMVSTNGLGYDADKIENMFGMNGWASEGGKHVFQRLTGKTGSIQAATHQLDMTSIGRALASANMPLRYREAAAEAARRGETFNTSTGNSLVYLGKDGMVQVETAIEQELGGSAVKHAANADVFMQASTHAAMIDRWVGIDKKYIERMFKQSTGPYEGREDASIFGRANKEIHAERGSVFHIRNGQFAQRGYGVSFVVDAISGEQRFAGNVRVDQAGLARTDIVSQGVKKGATAVMLSDMMEVHIDPNSEQGKALYEQLRRAGINPRGENLYAVRYGLVGEPSYARNEYVQIGTLDNLVRMFQDNDFMGKFDVERYKKGKQKEAERETAPQIEISGKEVEEAMLSAENGWAVDTSEVSGDVRKALGTADENGKYRLNVKAIEKRSERVLQEETAGNWLRTMDYKKAGRAVDILHDFTKFNQDFFGLDGTVVTAEQRNLTMKFIIEAYQNGEASSFKKGMDGDRKKAYSELTESIRGIMFNQNGKPERDIYPNTLRNFGQTFRWLTEMEPILTKVRKEADRLGTSDEAKAAYFDELYQGVLAGITQTVNQQIALTGKRFTMDDAIGRSVDPLKMTQEERDSFEVDLNDVMAPGKTRRLDSLDAREKNLFKINLEEPDSFGKRLASAMGLRHPEKQPTIINALHLFANSIYEQYSGLDEDLEKKLRPLKGTSDQTPAPAVLQQQIINGLKDIRKVQEDAGLPDAVRLMDIYHAPKPVQLLKKQQGKDFDKSIDDLLQNIEKDPSFTRFEEQGSAEDVAKKLTNALFKHTQDVTEAKLKKYGYSDARIEEILKQREQRKWETEAFMTDLFKGTYETNKYVGYGYSGDGRLVFRTSTNEEVDVSHLLPFDRFDEKTGQFYTVIGGRSISSKQIFSETAGSNDSGLAVHSLINEYTKALRKTINYAMSSKRSDVENIGNIDHFMTEALNSISDRAFTKFDEEDARESEFLDLSNFFKRLGMYQERGAYATVQLNERTKKLLDKLMHSYLKNNPDPEHNPINPEVDTLSASDWSTIYRDIDRLLAPLADRNSKLSQIVFDNDKDWESFQKILKHGTVSGIKHPEKGYIAVSTMNTPFLAGFGEDNRYVNQVIMRSKELDDKAVEEIRGIIGRKGSGESTVDSITRLGSVVKTAEEAERERNGLYREKVFRTAHLSLTQSELEKVMSSKFAQDKMKKLGMSAHEFFTYIGESGSISNPEYLKLFKKNIQQRERTNSLADLTTVRNRAGDEAAARENEIRTRTQNKLTVDDKGVHFSYSEDDAVLVKKGDVYAWERAYTGNNIDKQIADRTGFITRRYYDKNGDRISASEIEQVLSRPENAARLQSVQNASASGDGKQLRRVADEILNNAGYQQRYEIESVDYKPYRKILVNMEKSMSKFLMPSLGQTEGSKVGAALGNVAKERIEAALPAFLSPTVLNSMARTNAILKDAGLQEFTSEDQWRNFRNAIQEDNQRAWKTFSGIFEHEGYIAKGQQIGIVSTLENEAAKGSHSELGGRVTGAINEAVEYLARAKARGGAVTDKNYADASAEIRDVLIKNKVFTDADGNNVVKEGREGLGNESIEIGRASIFKEDKFNSIMTAYHPDYASKKTEDSRSYAYATPEGMQRAEVIAPEDGNGLASVRIQGQTVDGVYRYRDGQRVAKLGVGQIRAVDDADEGRLNTGGKGGVKLTRRFFAAADQDLVEMTGLLKEIHALDRVERASAGSGFSAQDEFNRMYRGIASAQKGEDGRYHINMESMADGQKVRRVNDPIIQNMKEELVAGTDPHRQFGVSEAGNKRFYQQLEREGISKEAAESIVNTYKGEGFSLIGADFVKDNYAYTTGLAAMNFNKEIQAASTEAEKQAVIKKYTGEHGLLGRNVINIHDADFSTQGNAANLNNLTERAGIVQIGDQYVAIGYQPASMMDNEKGTGTASRTKLRDVMSKIQSQTDHVIEANYKNTTSEFGNADTSIEEARGEVVRSVSSKEGAAAATTTGYLEHSGMFKGGIIRTNNGEVVSNGYHADLKTHINENPLLKEAKVGGRSILEHEAAGNHINAVFVGKDYFENLVRGANFQQGLAAIKGYDSVDQITEKDNQEALEAVLKQARSGGGIGIALRQPMEYQGSVQGVHVFYGEGIASNEMLLTESAATAMKLDKDGDQGYMNAIREQATIKTNDGKSVLTNARVSQIEVEGLKAVAKGGEKPVELDVQFKDNGDVFSRIEGAAGISANSTQSNYVGSDYDRKTGSKKSMEEGINAAQEHPEIRVGGNLYNLAGQDVGVEKRASIRNDYRDLITNNEHFQAFAAQQGIKIDAENPESFTAMDFAKNGGADKFVSYVKQNVGENEAEKVARTIGNAAAVEAIGGEESKMVMRTDAGLANMETYRMKRIVSNLEARGETNFQAGDANIISHFAEHLNDAFQAAKNSTAAETFTPESFGNALRDFFGVNRGRVRRTEPLMNMIQSMHDDGIKELFNVPVQEGIEHAPNEMISAGRVQQAFKNLLAENRVITQDAYEQARVGYTDQKGIEPKYIETNAADPKSSMDKAANELLKKSGLEDIQLIDGPLTAEARGITHHQQDLGLDGIFDESKVINAAEESMDIEDAVKGTFRAIGSALNHGGAKAMLGFAGAMMMAGMAGGAPTSPTPAQGQAKGIQSENAMYSIPSTMPSAGGNSQPQSYVINVNASTDRGRDFATQAINQAMSRFPQTAGGNRMTMNINDSSSSIGMGDISSYVSSML